MVVEQVKRLTGESIDAVIDNAGTNYSVLIVDTDMVKPYDLLDINLFSCEQHIRARSSRLR